MNLSDRDKRILKIAGPVLGGILVLFLVFNLVAGGGGDELASEAPVLPTGVTPLPSPSESGSPRPSVSPVVVFAGRDPFSIPPGLTPSAASVTASGSASTTSSASATVTSTVTPTPTPTSPSGGNSQDFTGRTIVLLDVFTRDGEDMAQVTVNAKPYTVAEGDRFSRTFELVTVASDCADFLHVEESFTLCTNAPK